MKNIDFSKIYSYSKLKLFEDCPQKYYFNYLDPEISPIKKQFLKPRDYKTKGQAIHGAITFFYHLSQEHRTFENLKKCLSDAWFSEINPEQGLPLGELGGFKDLKHERKVYFDSLKLLKKFFLLEEPNPSVFYLPTKNIKNSFSDYEEMIKPLNDSYSISGKFDRIDELEDHTLRIIDFKTNKKKSDKFQLIFYKLLAELNFQKPVRIVSFYYLSMGEIVDFDVSGIGQKVIQKQVLEKVEKIKNTQDFLPCFNGLCNHCDFFEICPARKIIKSPNGAKKHESNYSG